MLEFASQAVPSTPFHPGTIMQPRIRLKLCILMALGLAACTTTDQQVEQGIEGLAANAIGSPGWETAVDQLVAIGRPAARELIADLNPDYYKGVHYREYRRGLRQAGSRPCRPHSPWAWSDIGRDGRARRPRQSPSRRAAGEVRGRRWSKVACSSGRWAWALTT